MGDPVSHSNDLPPRDLGVVHPHVGRYVTERLANDDEAVFDGVQRLLVSLERARRSVHEPLGRAHRVERVADAEGNGPLYTSVRSA